ncbi:MAG: endonuclease/exonuclease/phosphatase family protein [Phycisphaerales bacterium]
MNGRKGKLSDQARRCIAFDCDIVCLQEVTLGTLDEWRELLASAGYRCISSVEDHPDQALIQGRRRYLTLIAGRPEVVPHTKPLSPAWTERSTSGVHRSTLGPIDVHTVHLPAGASDRADGTHSKSEMFECIAAHLAEPRESQCVLCGDFNSPWEELPDGRVLCFGGRYDRDGKIVARRTDRYQRQLAAESSVIEGQSTHGLIDAVRKVHGVDHDRYSFVQRRSGKAWYRRFDHVFLSAGLNPTSAHYDIAGLEEGLSDHAALVVDFELA